MVDSNARHMLLGGAVVPGKACLWRGRVWERGKGWMQEWRDRSMGCAAGGQEHGNSPHTHVHTCPHTRVHTSPHTYVHTYPHTCPHVSI
eukprot:136086-Chlamydomonas_euryale.AAC.1